MTLTEQQLRQMMPSAGRRLDAHLPYIAPAMAAAKIDTPDRIAAFLAQLAHESGEYRFLEELADGSAYEGRRDLGNIHPGDGVRFKGHGPIQITGRANHWACGNALGINLIVEPRLICTPPYATASACWFWTTGNGRGDLNRLADRGWFRAITRIVNGGYTHLDRRVAYWNDNRRLLGLAPIDVALEDAAIRAFQLERGLFVDGDAGRLTLAKLAA